MKSRRTKNTGASLQYQMTADLLLNQGLCEERVGIIQKMFDIAVISHCEDLGLADGGQMNKGFMATYLGLKGITKRRSRKSNGFKNN